MYRNVLAQRHEHDEILTKLQQDMIIAEQMLDQIVHIDSIQTLDNNFDVRSIFCLLSNNRSVIVKNMNIHLENIRCQLTLIRTSNDDRHVSTIDNIQHRFDQICEQVMILSLSSSFIVSSCCLESTRTKYTSNCTCYSTRK
jgi:hypothetical protein